MLNRLFKKQNHVLSSDLEQRAFKQILRKKIPTLRQMKYLARFIDSQEKKYITILLCIGLLSLILCLGRVYFFSLEASPAPGGTYTEGLVGQPKFINPILSASDIDSDLNRLIFSGLVKYDKNLDIKPDLAASLSISEDQKLYDFCLRENIFWHDGKKLTFDDVFFTFELINNPVLKNPLLERFKDVKLWPKSKNCFQFELKKPSNLFLSGLTLGILPKHIWQNVVAEDFPQFEFNLKPVGSGPFKFKSLAKDKSDTLKFYTLVRNEQFYTQIPYLEEIIFKFYANSEMASRALRAKEIDGLAYPPKEIREELNKIKDLENHPLDLPYYTAVFFNLRNPGENQTAYLREKAVREALAHLTPKADIFKKVLFGEGKMIHGPILPHSFAFNSQIKKYNYDSELAENILLKAGWQKNPNGFLVKNGKILEITLTTVNQPDLQKTAELIQGAWQSIGIRIKLIIVTPDQIQEIIKTRNFQCFLYGILENFNSDPYPLWHSSQTSPPGLNLTGFSHRRADELLEKAELAKNKNAKKIYWSEFQEIIADNIPAIFLYNTTSGYLVNQKIRGIDIVQIQHPSDRFIGIENWYIRTKREKKK